MKFIVVNLLLTFLIVACSTTSDVELKIDNQVKITKQIQKVQQTQQLQKSSYDKTLQIIQKSVITREEIQLKLKKNRKPANLSKRDKRFVNKIEKIVTE
ncbi:MAG: hypothetical protein ISR65_13155 [Bacteriovoracaceae bacterium]|nr:hypothetical protein [Bacteriovoracaceae bacterium]